MTGKGLFMGMMLAALILNFSTPTMAQGAADQFKSGCVVREWETDPTPSYRVGNPQECLRLDREIDGGDGPNRGRVRSSFRSGSRKGSHRNQPVRAAVPGAPPQNLKIYVTRSVN